MVVYCRRRLMKCGVLGALFFALIGTSCMDGSGMPNASVPMVSVISETTLPPRGSTDDRTPQPRNYDIGALVFNGTGTASSDTQSVINIISAKGLSYDVVSSSELNSMTSAELKRYGIIIWPGGVAKTMSDSISLETRIRVRNAIVMDGVSYIGFCAGSFIAGTYDWSPTWGLELLNIDFPYYAKEYEVADDRFMVDVSLPDGGSRALLFYGGPHLASFGKAIARYDDGTSAIAEDWVGNGFVILSGIHPEAPSAWKAGLFDRDGSDHEYAWQLIEAALTRSPLPSF